MAEIEVRLHGQCNRTLSPPCPWWQKGRVAKRTTATVPLTGHFRHPILSPPLGAKGSGGERMRWRNVRQPSCGRAALGFPLVLTASLSKPLMQESTSTYVLSSLPLVGYGTAFLCLYFLLPTTYSSSRGSYQVTLLTYLDNSFEYCLCPFVGASVLRAFLLSFFCALELPPLM